MYRHHRFLISLATITALLAPSTAGAQVPRFEQTPYSVLSGLRSLDVTTRRTSAASLARFRKNREAKKALIRALFTDPDVSVRQNVATSLSRMGTKARAALARAAICDPDPSTREGLADYGRRAKLRCDRFGVSMGDKGPVPAAEAMLIKYLGHPIPAMRRAAANNLIRMRSARGFQKIWIMASLDPVWKVRSFAMQMLTRSYRKKALPVVRHSLTQDPDARVRAQAIRELVTLRVRSGVKLIASSARVERIPDMRKVAIKSLAKIRTRMAVRELAALAEGHKEEDTRALALKWLASVKKFPKIVNQAMAHALRNDASGKVRAEALKALSTDMSDSACIARAESINDPHPAVRRALISQLSRCKASIARPALAKTVQKDQDATVRREAIMVLIKLGVAKAKGVIISALKSDRDTDVRQAALRAVKKLPKGARHGPLAYVATNDDEVDLRKAALVGLTKLSPLVAVPTLAQVLLKDKDMGVRLDAARALSRYRDAQAYKALTRAASSDPSTEVRQAAAAGAAKSPAQKAWIMGLLPQTIDPSASVRLRAIKKLCPLQAPRTYRALVRALWMDESSAVRTAVVKGFTVIDHPLADVGLKVAHDTDTDGAVVREVERSTRQKFQRLKKSLDRAGSDKASVRLTAVKTLNPSPFPQVRKLLERLVTKDDDAKVRLAAAVVLAKYQDKRALRKLMQASQSELHAKTRSRKTKMYNTLRGTWSSAKRALNIGTLLGKARSPKVREKVRALQALGILRDRRAFATLQAATKAANPRVRYAAVASLAIFGDVTIVPKFARTEKDPGAKKLLMQLNYLRSAPADKVVTALSSSKRDELLVAMNAVAMKPNKAAVPWLVRIALVNPNKELRLTAVQTLALSGHPLARWAILVASKHDASKKLRKKMWQWAVFADTRE